MIVYINNKRIITLLCIKQQNHARGFDIHPDRIPSRLEQVAHANSLTQPPTLTETGNEYQQLGDDALWLGKAGMACVWWQVQLYAYDTAPYKFTCILYFTKLFAVQLQCILMRI